MSKIYHYDYCFVVVLKQMASSSNHCRQHDDWTKTILMEVVVDVVGMLEFYYYY